MVWTDIFIKRPVLSIVVSLLILLIGLRAATTLARLLASRGDEAEALAVLAPVHDWFTECFDALDLVEEVTRLYVGSG